MIDDLYNYSGKLALLQAVCRDPRLGRPELAVMSVLIDHAHKVTGECYPSIARMTDAGNVSRSSAIRAVRRLEELGWIHVSKQNGALSNYRLAGVTDGTGATLGTGVKSARTGVKSNLRKGPTGSGDDTEAVPGMTPEQGKSKSNREEQGARAHAATKLDIPKWLPADAWELWRKHRGKKLTAMAERLSLAKLATLQAEGHDPRKIIELAVESGWSSFNPRESTRVQGAPSPKGILPRDTRTEDDIAAANEAQMLRLEAMA